jgi:hypothetical protein
LFNLDQAVASIVAFQGYIGRFHEETSINAISVEPVRGWEAGALTHLPRPLFHVCGTVNQNEQLVYPIYCGGSNSIEGTMKKVNSDGAQVEKWIKGSRILTHGVVTDFSLVRNHFDGEVRSITKLPQMATEIQGSFQASTSARKRKIKQEPA